MQPPLGSVLGAQHRAGFCLLLNASAEQDHFDHTCMWFCLAVSICMSASCFPFYAAIGTHSLFLCLSQLGSPMLGVNGWNSNAVRNVLLRAVPPLPNKGRVSHGDLIPSVAFCSSHPCHPCHTSGRNVPQGASFCSDSTFKAGSQCGLQSSV